MNECCICFQKSNNKTICNHDVCSGCLVKITKNNKYKCPICRRMIDNYTYSNYCYVKTIYRHKLKIKIEKLKAYVFGKQFKLLMERHIAQKYSNNKLMVKYTGNICINGDIVPIKSLSDIDVEYLLFCELNKSKRLCEYVTDIVLALREK